MTLVHVIDMMGHFLTTDDFFFFLMLVRKLKTGVTLIVSSIFRTKQLSERQVKCPFFRKTSFLLELLIS